MAFETLLRGGGTGHRAADPVLEAGQFVDEEIGRRPGADAEYAAGGQMGGDIIPGGARHGLLEFVLGHGGRSLC